MTRKRKKENKTELKAEVGVEAKKVWLNRSLKSGLRVEAQTEVQGIVVIAVEVDHKKKGKSQNITERNQGGQEVVHQVRNIQVQKEINIQNLTDPEAGLGTETSPLQIRGE